MKIISWNVNGIRACVKKGFVDRYNELDADILCVQETKAQDDQVKEALFELSKYDISSASAERKGYAGTGAILKQAPTNVSQGIGIEKHDGEGRVQTIEYDRFYLVNVYVPNSGRGLVRLDYRQEWDKDFLNYLKSLEKKKPVVAIGDFNVAHQPIDIARPKPNYNKTAGYTQPEIDGMTNFLSNGLEDTFRKLHPEEVAYSWWSFRANARAKNIGWRIDYVLVSKSLLPNVKEAFILPDVMGSDHCPVGVEMEF